VSQDVRERKDSFKTLPKWVGVSQKYLADVFVVNWQDVECIYAFDFL